MAVLEQPSLFVAELGARSEARVDPEALNMLRTDRYRCLQIRWVVREDETTARASHGCLGSPTLLYAPN